MYKENADRILAALAANGGMLTAREAEKLKIDRVTLKRAADAGVIDHVGWGKYALPDLPPRELQFRGVQLRCEAILSFLGAAYYWRLDGVDTMVLEWSIPYTTTSTVGRCYRRRNYHRLDVVERGGVTVTSVMQTLLDVAARHDADLVERMLESALRKNLTTDADMRDFVADHPHWQGAPTMRAVLARRRPGERPTGSDVETIALQAYRADGLEAIRQWEIVDERGISCFADFGFPPKACVSEIDGLEAHDEGKRQYDYNRQGRIEDVGYLVRRFTAEDVLRRPRYLCRRTRSGIAIARYL